jgi:predicted RNase H-like HicB family nuclease
METTTEEFSAIILKEKRLYIALCPELDVASQGKNIENALMNLKEALKLYLEDEDTEKLLKIEAPIVTAVKVNVNSSASSLRPLHNRSLK